MGGRSIATLSCLCFIKIQFGLTFLVPAYMNCPGKEAVKWMSVSLSACICRPGVKSTATWWIRDDSDMSLCMSVYVCVSVDVIGDGAGDGVWRWEDEVPADADLAGASDASGHGEARRQLSAVDRTASARRSVPVRTFLKIVLWLCLSTF